MAATTVEVRIMVGNSGIAQSGDTDGANQIYLGGGDEHQVILGNCTLCPSMIPEATIRVLPEPTTLLLLSVTALAIVRRKPAASAR